MKFFNARWIQQAQFVIGCDRPLQPKRPNKVDTCGAFLAGRFWRGVLNEVLGFRFQVLGYSVNT
jgi:hypothetical protein